MNDQIRLKTKEVLDTILEKMGFSGLVDEIGEGDELSFVVKSPKGGILIGNKGANLTALNHIFRKIVKKKILKDGEAVKFSLDVNDYQKQRKESLREEAKMNAQRVRYFKKNIELSPMSAYERKVIHDALTEYADIKTESVGEGEGRRVVIKPY